MYDIAARKQNAGDVLSIADFFEDEFVSEKDMSTFTPFLLRLVRCGSAALWALPCSALRPGAAPARRLYLAGGWVIAGRGPALLQLTSARLAALRARRRWTSPTSRRSSVISTARSSRRRSWGRTGRRRSTPTRTRPRRRRGSST